MKKILLLLAVILTAAIGAYSQAPGIFNYQGVARNSVGNVLINQAIALRLTIHDGTAGGPVAYQEVRGVTTNPFGLFNAQVGSAGFTSQIGTIAGVPWAVGNKYIQVEIDPNGGSSFINIGTAQIASVPYALFTPLSGDLILPFNKTQSDAGTLFKITNSGNGAGSTSLEGLTNSLAANVSAIIGTVTTASAGSFSAGVKGINNGNAGFGIGVWGTQNGSGWGVYGVTPSGLGVFGSSTSGVGVQGSSTSGNGVNGSSSSAIGVFGTSNTGNAGRFDNTNAANTSDALQANTNGTNTSWAIRATSTGAQGAGFFVYNNAGGNANALRVTNNGSGAALNVTATNSGSAGTFSNTNAGNGSSTLIVSSNSNNGVGLQVNQTGTSQVSAIYGNISTTTPASAAINGADFSSGGAIGVEARTYGVVGQTGTTGIAVGGYANIGGTALRGSGGGLTGYALQSTGRVQLAGIGENLNWILRSDAVGNATWANPAILLGGLFWSTTGNAGNIDATNFIGNVDNVPFNIRVNNQKAGRLDKNLDNTFYGIESGSANYTAAGRENTGVGVNSLNHNTTGINNTGIGSDVLYLNTTGSDNTGTGRQALYNNTTGSSNTAYGRETLISNTTGNFNTASGWDALYSNTTGNNNTGSGFFALITNTTGSRNTGVGSQADVATAALTNATAVGANAQVSANNSLVLGSINGVNGGTADVNVGIGITAPVYKLDVVHGGGTGIRDRGTAGFSVMDVDASNGDAALRFLNNGAFRWNIRNDPAGNDLQIFDMGAGVPRMRILTANGNVGINNGAPAYRLDVDASTPGSSNGIRVQNTTSFATVDIIGATIDQALRFGKNGVLNSGINTLPDGDHINFFKFGGVQNLMSLNVNTGNLGVGGPGINAVSKVSIRGFNVANNLYSSSTGFLGATGLGVNDITAQPTNEKWGIHTFVNGGVGTQHAIFAEPGTTAAINTGLFGRVSTAPAGGQSYGLFALDAVNNASTWAATIRGRLQYQDGSEGINKILRSTDALGDATWSTLAAAGIVSGAGVATRVAFWNSASTISSNANLYWDDVSSRLGIGTAVPAYPLDVVHGGATGAHIASTASFSVVDIDAATGDAALRFQKAGVGQWNTRNRPADNYYEIFELGGGGSRMVIQDATGFVGIGAGPTISPSYQLDVENTGANGIRSKSSASFSVVDIDAASGDAALRFAFAGVNQWNIRNRPGDNYLEIFELGGGGSRMAIQDATGNVGIGNTGATIAYRLDVQHGGATGIRSQSTASFSVVDIDGFSGDAALRFANNGVNQWNMRNDPANNNLQIFELGGGGERMEIQDGTGNIGIGNIAPAYRLDVQHGGATGVHVVSTATFSVVDIDAANGDAALRFQKAGVNQWNTRNNPATNDYQIFELGGGGERLRINDGTGKVVISGDLDVGGTLTKGAGAFKIDHPLDPENKYLVHSFVESPDMMNIYNGNIVTDASGKATVQLPDYFEALNMEFRYQLTVIGAFAQAIINKEVSNNQFEIATNQPNVKVSWQVTGIRHDAYANKNRIPNTVEKEAKNKGKYLSPESFNQPKSKGINYTDPNDGVSSLNDMKPAEKKAVDPASITGGSLDYTAPKTATNKLVDNSGSVMQTEATKPATKKADNSGSVSDEIQKPVIKTQENKTDKAIEPAKEVKETLPAALKGSSMDPNAKPIVPAAKTQEVKLPAQNSGNTQPAIEQKQVSKENSSVPSSTVPVKKD